MPVSSLAYLFISPILTWIYLWNVGYHGAFLALIISLIIVVYFTFWDLHLYWLTEARTTFSPLTWIEFGNSDLINFSFSNTSLVALVLIIMSFGAAVVLLFVYIEMWDDKEGANFAILLILFLGFMGILVSSANMFIFYLGWEGIGMTSLFLISFWGERARAIKATLKVYTINKIGDFLIVVGLMLVFIHTGLTNFEVLTTFSPLILNYDIICNSIALNWLEFAALFLVIGGGVKSAQFGFHIWLLEAMEAPLGASALMHSSTLVIAGVVLIYKLNPLIELTQLSPALLILWGGWTALFAALIACFQFELKIIMAYSTISSMGFLYCLLGLNAYSEMLNYLTIHAFIKIFFFLVVGAIMLHCSGCQDMRWMGGLFSYIPGLYICYVIGGLNLAGLPYWSGYYCKTAAWFAAATHNTTWSSLQLILVFTTALTYTYLIRTGYLVFFNSKNGHRHIYRTRVFPWVIFAGFATLGSAAALSGATWTHLCQNTTAAIKQSINANFMLSAQLELLNSILSWTYLIGFYTLFFCTVCMWLYLANRTTRTNARTLQITSMITQLMLVIYTIN